MATALLAKVGVEGSNPFARSNFSITYIIGICFPACGALHEEALGKQARSNFSVAARKML
ncbi:MAG: hypothetical protein HC869_18470 [Rhodospirillales bacterium]|nr:hypothetical protein [Rhodospirillales bacterium]